MKFLLIASFFAAAWPPNFAHGQTWQFYTVDSGVKPALDLDSNGMVHISYMLEDNNGYVKHAIWNAATMQFDTSTVANGYFYGPLDLAIDHNDMPHINYHDHTFEDQVHLYLSADGWINERIQDGGHDGWDNSIEIDMNNYAHTSTIHPVSFGFVGVEYAFFDGTDWQVEPIGSDPVDYANSTSLALDSQEWPHITWFNDSKRDLMYAEKDSAGWTISTVESDGDVGRFASLRLDASDIPHISYYQHLGGAAGLVKFARWNGSDWSISTVDTLKNVFLGFAGARNMTSLVLDATGKAHISYGDEKVLKYAVGNDATWQKETVLDFSSTTIISGQLTSLRLDDNGLAHIAYFKVTSKTPLTGIVKYAVQSMPTAVVREAAGPVSFQLLRNFPNPFNPSTTIRFSLRKSANIRVSVFDLRGREVAVLLRERRAAGEHEIVFHTNGLASGVYLYRLETGAQILTKKMLLLR